ncbi:MAG TPA: penicillin-binding protein activator LpoB [Paraburkholderia sp.]|nr:penicillin-binding protein activator LpoB [Paraburkholderia sp.]
MIGFKKFARRASWYAAVAASVLAVAACSTIRKTDAPSLAATDTVAVAQIANYTETPDAGRSAGSIAANALRVSGLTDVRLAPADTSANAMFDSAQRDSLDKKLEWARAQHVRFVLTGAVEEWRYKAGVDGEPVVGVTFELVDVASGKVVWSASGSKTGWSRSGLSSIATALIGDVLSPLGAHR